MLKRRSVYVKLECPCGKEYELPPAEASRSRCCSLKCRKEFTHFKRFTLKRPYKYNGNKLDR